MYRALIGLFLCTAPALAQYPGYFRPTDGIVLTREQERAFLARVYEAYWNLPDDLTFVDDELRVERAVRPANGVWVVVEMTLDGRRLPLSEFDGLTYEFQEGVFWYLDSPFTRAVPPFALVDWRTPEAESVFTPLRESILQDYADAYWGGFLDYKAIRPRMLYAGEGGSASGGGTGMAIARPGGPVPRPGHPGEHPGTAVGDPDRGDHDLDADPVAARRVGSRTAVPVAAEVPGPAGK